jgi:3-methylcrotonyl-CoA carboxylase alpha subunit
MRRVERAADFAAALASCQREAAASFGDARVLIEKYLLQPRHIEIQVFTDAHGNGVYLFERDCSVQRRHQKVLEEAPAPGMDPKRRAGMGAAALAAAKAVGYVGAGTVEFIAEPGGKFFFMEMNTRLQVEHPVTEMITGLDLVEWQLRVASGDTLPLSQKELAINGHAIEARIYAEDPERGFLPATGRLEHYRTPAATAAVRIDSGVEQGDEITPYYDPMIAKLIVWGASRELARDALLKALEQFQIVGLSNNVQFLSRLVATPAFANADLDTALIEREHSRLFAAAAPVPDEALIAASLRVVEIQRQRAHEGPGAEVWRSADSWRLNAPAARTFHFRTPAERYVVVRPSGAGYLLQLDTRTLRLQCVPLSATDARLSLEGSSFDATSLVRDGRCDVFLRGVHHRFEYVDPLAHVGEQAVAEGNIRAIMPSRIVALLVKPGARVARGEPLLILEAMKMEHTLGAPADGICEAFNVAVGEQVTEGSELVVLTGCPPDAAPSERPSSLHDPLPSQFAVYHSGGGRLVRGWMKD